MRAAERALALEPRSAEALNNVAAAYAGLGEWDRAAQYARQALAISPGLEIARNNLQWFEKQRLGEAHPPSPQGSAEDYLNLSLRFYRDSRYPEGLAAARRATELNPRLAEAWNNVAANAEALHHWDDAIAAARTALELRPDFQLAKNNLEWSLGQQLLGAR